MKMVIAFVQPFMTEKVVQALPSASVSSC